MKVYSIFNKNKKIDISTLEKILFKYIFKMDIELAQDIIEILNNIDKMNKNKTPIIRILSKFKELMKELTILSLEENTTNDFKIIIEKRKIKTSESKKNS
jgi:Fe2+ transport system protein B